MSICTDYTQTAIFVQAGDHINLTDKYGQFFVKERFYLEKDDKVLFYGWEVGTKDYGRSTALTFDASDRVTIHRVTSDTSE